MGIDADIFIKHNFFEKNINYTLEKLKIKTNSEIIIYKYGSNYKKTNDSYWSINIGDENNIKDYFSKNRMIQLIRHWKKTGDNEEIWFTENNFDITGEKLLMPGRWNGFEDYLIPFGFNSPPLWGVKSGGAGDLFPRIRKDFKVKSSIPRRSAAGIFY